VQYVIPSVRTYEGRQIARKTRMFNNRTHGLYEISSTLHFPNENDCQSFCASIKAAIVNSYLQYPSEQKCKDSMLNSMLKYFGHLRAPISITFHASHYLTRFRKRLWERRIYSGIQLGGSILPGNYFVC
jgi:hypothetical protein